MSAAHHAEGRGWLERALALGGDAPVALRAKALGVAGRLAVEQGDPRRAEALIGESLALWRELGDQEQVAVNLVRLGLAFRAQERYAEAAARTEEAFALYEELGDRRGRDSGEPGAGNLGRIAIMQGDYARAADYLAEALNRQRALGYSWGICQTLNGLGHLARVRGDLVEAVARYRESLDLARALGDQWMAALVLAELAAVALAWGQPKRAARLLGAVAAIDERTGGAIHPFDRANRDRTRAAAQAALGEAAFAAAWAAGRALPPETVIAEVLNWEAEPDPPAPVVPVPEPVVTTTPAADPFGLSRREREVLALLARRHTDPEIAASSSSAPAPSPATSRTSSSNSASAPAGTPPPSPPARGWSEFPPAERAGPTTRAPRPGPETGGSCASASRNRGAPWCPSVDPIGLATTTEVP